MDLINVFSCSEIEDVSLLIKCLLDRIPIVVLSDDEQRIDDIINELADLIPFRNKLIFLSDFINKIDFMEISNYEDSDLNIERNVFLCFPHAIQNAIKNIDTFQSWIFGVLIDKNSYTNYIQVYNELYAKTNYFLKLEIGNTNLKTEIVGRIFPNFDLKLEKWIYENAINRTEIEIEKMKRIIAKKTKFRKIPQEKKNSIMNFEIEEKEIKENIIKKEILNFFNACKRSINILHRMQILYDLNIKTNISPRVLFGTIAYKQAPIERILQFIDNEWSENFMHLLNMQNTSNFSDTFESLWG
ncbi:MAG: hypothetical protein DRO88_06900 [Promethearchaeia archaeon]|nr:MAG: hypothetical protein DRO88_06900 [Candidatus Lokiarchaeia archaeon]